MTNTCRDRLRSQTSQTALNKSYVEVNELIRAGDRDTQAQIDWLYTTLDTLRPQLRETAILVVAEEMTHSQAGEVLGIKEATVSWRMHEIRKELKALASAGDGDRL